VDQTTVNQTHDLPHRLPSALKVNNRNGLAEASPFSFLSIALHIAVCGHGEDVDQPAAWPEPKQ
jgi:hypothetical protein